METKSMNFYYEARFARDIKSSHTNEIYQKGKVFCVFDDKKQILAFFKGNMPCYDVIGHGVYNYFNPKKDFNYFEIKKTIEIIDQKIEL